MSQRAGDYGSILMGCSNSYNLKKYGSAEACLDAELPKNKMLTYEEIKARGKDYPNFSIPLIGGSDTEKKVFEMKRAERQLQDEEAKKVRKKYIIYGLIAVAGYFAYKKFKK